MESQDTQEDRHRQADRGRPGGRDSDGAGVLPGRERSTHHGTPRDTSTSTPKHKAPTPTRCLTSGKQPCSLHSREDEGKGGRNHPLHEERDQQWRGLRPGLDPLPSQREGESGQRLEGERVDLNQTRVWPLWGAGRLTLDGFSFQIPSSF